MSLGSSLRLDWASTEAAQFACKRWHYTGKMPNAGVKIGIWEGETFVGVILFGVGAANATNGKAYGLAERNEIAELCRVAMKPGHRYPVSRCIAIAVRMLKQQSPRLRMIISFADTAQGHHGGIYQAGNWIYAGLTAPQREFVVHGKQKHAKTIHSNGWKQNEKWLRENVDPAARAVTTPGKHRYLMPLDDDIRDRVKTLAQPYPKRAK